MRLLSDILASILDAAKLRRLPETGAGGMRIETVPIASVGNEGRYILNITKGGPTTVTGRNPGYDVGQNVKVVTQDGAPMAIIGHEMLKAQFHPTGGEFAEVEELIATRNNALDGGIDYWLRSANGLYYLDVRSIVEEAGVPPQYVTPGVGIPPSSVPTRFPDYIQADRVYEHMKFGQADNQFAILAWNFFDVFESSTEWAVLYVFEIERPLHSTDTPSSGTFTRLGVDYPKLDFRLVGYYVLDEIDLDTGITVVSKPTVSTTQYLPVKEYSTFSTWVPPAGDAEGYYEPQPHLTTIDKFHIDIMGTASNTEITTYPVVLNAFYYTRFIGGATEGSIYQTKMKYWWIDPDGKPILVWTWENWDQILVWLDLMGYGGTSPTPDVVHISTTVSLGTDPITGQQVFVETNYRAAFSARNFFPNTPLVVIRLDTASGDNGALTAVKIGQSCEDVVQIEQHHEEPVGIVAWTETPRASNPLYGYLASHNAHTNVGGPSPGIEHSWSTISLGHDLRWWQLYPFDSWWPGLIQEQGFPGVVFPDYTLTWGAMSEIPTNKPEFGVLDVILSPPYPVLRPGYMYVGEYPSLPGRTGEISLTIWQNIAGLGRGGTVVLGGRTIDGSPDDFVLLLKGGEHKVWPHPSNPDGQEHIASWRKVTPTSREAGGDFVTVLRSWQDPPDLGSAEPFLTVPSLSRDHALLEYPVWMPREVAILKDGTILSLPDELGAQDLSKLSNANRSGLPQVVVPISCLAPDRLYDNREEVQKFRKPIDTAPVLSTPKPKKLADVSVLDGFIFNHGYSSGSALGSAKANHILGPSRMHHTVSKKTNKP